MAGSGQRDNGERNGLPEDSSGSPGRSGSMRIHGWTDGKGGTSWYRMKEPARALRLRGHDVTVSPMLFDGKSLNDYDALMVRALHDRWNSDGWRRLAELGRHALVYDLDDDVWNWHSGTEQYRYWTEQRLEQAEINISLASVVTTPSAQFATYLRELNCNVVVIPNTVPVWLTRINPPKTKRPFVIGWEGAPHHIDDLKLVWGSIFRFLLKHRDTEFWLWGPHGFEDLPLGLRERVRTFPWQSNVPDYYRSLDMDIALAPLQDTSFNETKSAIRVQEHSALGIPVIASPSEAYAGYLHDGVNGFLASSEEDWELYLNLLYDRPDIRYDLGREGRKLAVQWTTEANASLWEQVVKIKEVV
jgi:glycosyltransferase involved in cell wall biosynthesis